MRDYQVLVRDLSKAALKSKDREARLFWSLVISSALLKAKTLKIEPTSHVFFDALVYLKKMLEQTLNSLPPNQRTLDSTNALAIETLKQLDLVNSVLPEPLLKEDMETLIVNEPKLRTRKEKLTFLVQYCEDCDLLLDKMVAMDVINSALINN